jgi:8-oxo-dGTP pyrophosphatase MutT (NUDIX family)
MMERLYEAVDAYFECHPGEADLRPRLQPARRGDPSLLHRASYPYHWTASAWMVDPRHEVVLLLLHPKLQRWLQPGGHADGNDDLPRVALKEAREETGIVSLRLASDEIFDLDVHPIPPRGQEPAHFHMDARYFITADCDAPLDPGREAIPVSWVEIGSLLDAEDAGLKRMAEKTVARGGDAATAARTAR